jgi:hypothetical protein
MRNRLAILLIACASSALAQSAEPPVVLGTLGGATAPHAPVHGLYGTDLGWTFPHNDQLVILFGDSWREQDSVCSFAHSGLPKNDDAFATLPMSYPGSVPTPQFAARPDFPDAFEPIQVIRDGVSLNMGLDRTPLTGWSDGVRAIAAFESADFLRCDGAHDGTCPAPFQCTTTLGECQPSPLEIPQLCDAKHPTSCGYARLCISSGKKYCIDRSSSQPQAAQQAALEVELSVPRDTAPTVWDSKLTFPTNKFYNMTSRTVRSLGADGQAADYRPGNHTLLIWGRPGFLADPDSQVGLYLLAHDLPFQEDAAGKLVFTPRYFAGLEANGSPRWTPLQERAVPLALDGVAGGNPTETVRTINQMAISWLDAPLHKWVMLYGGGRGGWVPRESDSAVAAGAIAVRFADQPWGPWSPAQTYWSSGRPDQAHTPLGPGGVIFHPDCVAQGSLGCMPSDPVRPSHVFNDLCAPPSVETDTGFLYAPNIIDAYTQPNPRGGLDVYWNVSTWNPYRVLLMRSSFFPH